MAEYTIPNEKTVKFLKEGLIAFYPDIVTSIFSLTGKYPLHERWNGFERIDFSEFIFDVTNSEDIAEAAAIIRQWEQQVPNPRTVPTNIDELVADLEEKQQNASEYNKRQNSRNTLNLIQQIKERQIKETSRIKEQQTPIEKVEEEKPIEVKNWPRYTPKEAVPEVKLPKEEGSYVYLNRIRNPHQPDFTPEDEKNLLQFTEVARNNPRGLVNIIQLKIISAYPPAEQTEFNKLNAEIVATDFTTRLQEVDRIHQETGKWPVARQMPLILSPLANPENVILKKSPNPLEIAANAQAAATIHEQEDIYKRYVLEPFIKKGVVETVYGSPFSEDEYAISEDQSPNSELKIDIRQFQTSFSHPIKPPQDIAEDIENNDFSDATNFMRKMLDESKTENWWIKSPKAQPVSNTIFLPATSAELSTGYVTTGVIGGIWASSNYPILTSGVKFLPPGVGAQTISPILALAKSTPNFVKTPLFLLSYRGNIAAAYLVPAKYSTQIAQGFYGVNGLSSKLAIQYEGKPLILFGFKSAGKETAIQFLSKPLSSGTASTITGVRSVIISASSKISSAVSQISARLGLTAITTQLSTALGALSGVVMPVIGAIVGFVFGKLLELLVKGIRWLFKHPEYLLLGLSVPLFLAHAPLVVAVLPATLGALMLATGAGTVGGAISGTAGFIGGVVAGVAIDFLALAGIIFVVTPILVAFIMLIITNSAYVTPPSKLISATSGSTYNPYISVSKVILPQNTASVSFDNSALPKTIEYQITVKPLKGPLKNLRFNYKCEVIRVGSRINCPDLIDSTLPTTALDQLDSASSLVFTYKQNFTEPDFKDTLNIDTFTVTAEVPTYTSETSAAASASVKIGNPPDQCPAGWPVDGKFPITQGPRGSFSHTFVEAIDIATPMGITLKATHSGVAHVTRVSDAYRPLRIDIYSQCGGVAVRSTYAHLSSASVIDGQQVSMGQNIGATGSDGTGPHLHYEFGGINMTPPYIPKPVLYGCGSVSTCGWIP